MDDDEPTTKKMGKQHNVLPLWGNEASMNLNPLILTNIQNSSYFKVSLFKLKTYHEVVDEIYYQVKHMEPWEKGSRKTSGQSGMCGGVRGVGAGGIVSSAYCLLYKLYTLRLTRKQVNGLLSHTDSPYIRALGFMYIRYTQPPNDLYDWYEDYLQDDEEIDVKAGSGQTMTIGQMLRQWLVKLDWFSTLFPRIPVPIQKSIEQKLGDYSRKHNLDNRLTFAEKEMSKRRGMEPDRGSSSIGGGRGYEQNSRDPPPTSRGEYSYHDNRGERGDRYAGGGSGEGGYGEYRNYEKPSRDRSRSRERTSRVNYGDSRKESSRRDEFREKDRGDNSRYKDLHDRRDRGSERDSYEKTSHKDRDRKYR